MISPWSYTGPHIQSFIPHLNDATISLKIDLIRTNHQISVESEDIAKTAIIIAFGLFENLKCLPNPRMLHSLSVVHWQSCMSSSFCFAYFDNLLMAGRSPEELKAHTGSIFSRLNEFVIRINPQKCLFGMPYHAEGILHLQDRVEIILSSDVWFSETISPVSRHG